ncbi:hypothetical protein FB107DRAFT_248590 [Schizophyllum commune]
MRSFRPCREASAVREVRASAQLQREQDSDLRDSTLNLGRLAALRALDGTATIPLSPSQTQVSPATSRGPLRNNEPGAHAAPAAVTQARAAPVATETRTLGDGCAGSSESASQTDRQSSQVNDRLSNAPPYVGLSQDPSMAPAFSTALDTSIIRDDDTHVLYSTEHISDEAFPGTRLRIRVSSGRALGNRSQPLDHAIRMLCVILRGQQHHLTQLHLTIKHSRVVGGQCDGIDTVVALLSGVKNHLHCFLSAHVKYVCEQDEQPGQRVARDISNAFCKLLRLKIEGSTTSSRLAVFPLRHLQHLEILMKISETDVGILLRVCRSLDVLVIRSAASTHNRLESFTFSTTEADYECTRRTDLRMTISQFCTHFVELHILENLNPYSDLRGTLTAAWSGGGEKRVNIFSRTEDWSSMSMMAVSMYQRMSSRFKQGAISWRNKGLHLKLPASERIVNRCRRSGPASSYAID